MSERSIRNVLTSLEKKGLLRRKVSRNQNGRTNGVVFSVDPLVRKLKSIMKKTSPTVGEENDPYVGEEFFRTNTEEEFNKREESKNTSAETADIVAGADESVSVKEEKGKKNEACDSIYSRSGETGGPRESAGRNDRRECAASQIHLAPEDGTSLGGIRSEFRDGEGGPRRPVTDVGSEIGAGVEETAQDIAAASPPPRNDGERGGNAYSSTRWYNEVFRELYETASGQPALTGGREYKSAETYFRRLRELNREMTPGEIYELAGEGAAFMIASQLEGGVFGWVNRPPDVCILASQAQSVDWHLRKARSSAGARDGGSGRAAVRLSFIEKIREQIKEGLNAGEQIERVYGELRGIESASAGRAIPSGSRALRRKRG